jgi:IS30 family transposase
MRVSHETIYRTLYVQTRGALKKELKAHLRRSTGIRRNIHAKRTGHGMGQIADAVSISVRPPEAADRAVPGHWEGDLLAGNKHSNIATLVERQSRFVMLVRLQKRDTGTVVKAVARRIKRLPLSLKQSLTWDRGKRWPNTSPSRSRPMSWSVSVIPAALGIVVQMRIPMVCFVSTFQKARI